MPPSTAIAADPLDDFVSLDQIAEENPAFPLATLRYLSRSEVRGATGFASCMRRLTPRRVVVSRSAFAAWVNQQTA